LALGFSAVVTQLVLLRELLSAFSGNELGLGVMLGAWLLLMGLGSWAGRSAARLKNGTGVFVWGQILLALWPLVAVFLLRALRNVVLIRGVEAGVVETVLGCLVVLFPYCLVSGYLLTLTCVAPLTGDQPLGVGTVYFLDSAGSILGGMLFTFLLVYFFSPFGALAWGAFLNLAAALALGCTYPPQMNTDEHRLGTRHRKFHLRLSAFICGFTALGLAATLALCDLDRLTTAWQYPESAIAYTGNSPYGRLVVTESAGQYSFYENGVLCFSTQNVEEVEEKIHYAMAQRPRAQRVLLLSGGISGTAKEILKYGVARLDYVELDPLAVECGRKFVPENLADARISVIAADARFFVRETQERYDVVLVGAPEPSTSQLNRLYTREFYQAVNRILVPGGVLGFAAGEYLDYVSPELGRTIATTHATLKSVFANVMVIPGSKVAYLASQGPLYTDIASRIEGAGVQTRWMKRQYLRSVFEPGGLGDMERAAATPAALNEDFSPVLYYEHLRHWMSKFENHLGLLAGCLAVVLALFFWRMRAVSFAIFTAGFAASALELVLLMGFQIVFGSVYQQLGVIITAFMAGLAAGSWWGKRSSTAFQAVKGHGPEARATTDDRQDACPTTAGVAWLAVVIALLAAGLPLVLRALGAGTAWAHAGFVLLAFIIAAAVGLQFTLAGRKELPGGAAASDLYTADFLGACLGALLPSALLIPLWGVNAVCELIGLVNLCSGVVLWIAGRRRF